MSCYLDIDKVRQGIIDSVKAKLDPNIFSIGERIVIRDIQDKPLTEEQIKLVEEARQYKDDIKGFYKTIFDQDPARFLREIADQAYSSSIEMESSNRLAGDRLFDIAMKAFPNKFADQEKLVDDLNKEFGSEVLVKTSKQTYKIDPSEELIINYIMRNEGSGPLVMDYLRDKYLAMFSEGTLNLMDPDIWLNHPVLQKPEIQNLLKFMKKINPEAKLAEFEDLDQNAVALIRDHIILVRNGHMIDDLPEEVAHFFVELANKDLQDQLMKAVIDYPIYGKTFEELKNNPNYMIGKSPNIDKIKREAAAKLIGEYIRGEWNNKPIPKKSKIAELVSQLMKFLRKVFSISMYTEPINVFSKAAKDINAQSVESLNIQKIPSIYDSVFFSAVESQMPESYEASDLAKSLFNFSDAIRKALGKTFRDKVNNSELKGLKEVLEDQTTGYNRIFDIIGTVYDSNLELKNLFEDHEHLTKEREKYAIASAAAKLGEAYREMEIVPKAISNAITKLKAEGKENALVDNIKELQTYFKFSTTFKGIIDEFKNILYTIKSNKELAPEDVQHIYESMRTSMGSTEIEFNIVDNEIMESLKQHLVGLMDKWTSANFEKYRNEWKAIYNDPELTDKDLRGKVQRYLTDRISDIKQVRNVIEGNFADSAKILEDGKPVKLDKIKDISQSDYLIFLFSSSSLVEDPIISNIVAFYNDEFAKGITKGLRESKVFADKMVAQKVKLSKIGVDWYDAERAIQNVQKFFDYSLSDKVTEKRTLLSETDRFNFFHDAKVKREAINAIMYEVRDLQREYITSPKTELADEIKIKKTELDKLRKDYNEFLEKEAYGPYTPAYRELVRKNQPESGDSDILKSIKEIQRRILNLQEKQAYIIMSDETIDNLLYEDTTQELAALQDTLRDLRNKLPEQEKINYDERESIYEVDEVSSKRLQERHRSRWIKSLVAARMKKEPTADPDMVGEQVYNAYNNMFTGSKLTEAARAKLDALYKAKDDLSTGDDILKAITDRIEEIKNIRTKILKNYRSPIYNVSISSFKDSRIAPDVLTSEVLKELEEENTRLWSKLRIYKAVSSSVLNPEERDNMLAFTEMLYSFNTVINNPYMTTDKVIKTFENTITLSPSDVKLIKEAIEASRNGNHSLMEDLKSANFTFKTEAAKSRFQMLKLGDISGLIEAEKQFDTYFKELTRRATPDEVSEIQSKIDQMYVKRMTMEYLHVFREFHKYFMEYISDEGFDHPDKDIHIKVAESYDPTSYLFLDGIEQFYSNNLMEAVLGYLYYKQAKNLPHTSTYSVDDYVRFYLSLHKMTTSIQDGMTVNRWTPCNYAVSGLAYPEDMERFPAKFLTRYRVKDSIEKDGVTIPLKTEKINELDPRVRNGSAKPTVDINGEWLPLPDSSYKNEEYAKLRDGKDEKSKLLFNFLESMKKEYLEKQVLHLEEGERLDLVIPARHLDNFEQKRQLLTNFNEAIKTFRNATPLAFLQRGIKEENIDYEQEIGAITAENRAIYDGAIIAEDGVKLRSRRRLPVNRASIDATSSITMFIEEVNEYEAKNIVSPVFKSFADTLMKAYEENPDGNKYRSTAIKDLYDTKVLGKVPDNFANNRNIAKAMHIMNKLATLRLLGDPLGGIINITSGEINNMIEAAWSREEYLTYLKSGAEAASWWYDYNKDFYRQSTVSLATQMIGTFNMMPEVRHTSHQLSKLALATNVRNKLMAPRSKGEEVLGIHLGLSILLAKNIDFKGTMYSIPDLYQLSEDTGLMELKPEFSSLKDEWDPVEGSQVSRMRKIISQKYTLLQGNFFGMNQSYISNTALGKSAELMKRWFVSGVIRRWQGEVIDPFLGDTRKGFHRATVDLMGAVVTSIRKGNLDYVKQYWNILAARPSERLALQRSMSELMYVTAFIILGSYVLGYSSSDPDKNKKLMAAGYWKQIAILLTERIQGELGTYIPVPVFGLGYMEMKRAILDPFGVVTTSGFNNVAALGSLLTKQMLYLMGVGSFEHDLYYQKDMHYDGTLNQMLGYRQEGSSKLWAIMLNTIGYNGYTSDPANYVKTLDNMQNRVK